MKQKPILPFVTTPGLTVAYNRVTEVATKPVDASTAATIVYGGSGCGKTELRRKLARELAWQGPPADYASHIIRRLNQGEVTNEQQSDLARRAGLIDEDDEDNAEKFYALLRERHEASGHRWSAPGEFVWGWFHFIAERLGLPRPNPVGLLRLWGIVEPVKNRYPIVVEAVVRDRPSHLQAKLLQALGLESGQLYRFRGTNLIDIMQKFPMVLIVDEADMLHEESLHAIRQVCDLSATPLVLMGTDLLRTRLLRHPSLRPLATRVGMRIELGTVTARDLRRSLPGMDDEIVLEVFRQGGGYFRTISILLLGLRGWQDANPGRRITREIVQVVAKRILTAVGVRTETAPATRGQDVVFTDEDLGVEFPAEALAAVAQVAPARAARAIQKVG